MACLVFISSMGLVVNKHYCNNDLKSLSLFFKAKNCGDAFDLIPCPIHGMMKVPKEKDCCKDESSVVKEEAEQSFNLVHLDFVSPIVFPNLIVEEVDFPTFDQTTLNYLNFKPPLLVKDFKVHFQTFLC